MPLCPLMPGLRTRCPRPPRQHGANLGGAPPSAPPAVDTAPSGQAGDPPLAGAHHEPALVPQAPEELLVGARVELPDLLEARRSMRASTSFAGHPSSTWAVSWKRVSTPSPLKWARSSSRRAAPWAKSLLLAEELVALVEDLLVAVRHVGVPHPPAVDVQHVADRARGRRRPPPAITPPRIRVAILSNRGGPHVHRLQPHGRGAARARSTRFQRGVAFGQKPPEHDDAGPTALAGGPQREVPPQGHLGAGGLPVHGLQLAQLHGRALLRLHRLQGRCRTWRSAPPAAAGRRRRRPSGPRSGPRARLGPSARTPPARPAASLTCTVVATSLPRCRFPLRDTRSAQRASSRSLARARARASAASPQPRVLAPSAAASPSASAGRSRAGRRRCRPCGGPAPAGASPRPCR